MLPPCGGFVKRASRSRSVLARSPLPGVTNLSHFPAEIASNLDKLLCDVRMRSEAAGILAWKEVRAMSEELREMEARLFRSLKEALEKNKALARSCLA